MGINIQTINSQSVKNIDSLYINSSTTSGHLLIFKGNERKHIGYQINQNGVTSEI